MSKKERLPIAVIFGGEGAEREISLKTADYIIRGLHSVGANVLAVEIDKSGLWYIRGDICEKFGVFGFGSAVPTFPVKILENGKAVSGFFAEGSVVEIAGAVPALHGDMGEDGNVQGALRCAGISFFGAEVSASAILFDKAYAKILAEFLGIPTVPWFLYIEGGRGSSPKSSAGSIEEAKILAEEIGYPLFVKPCKSGSSFGASVVNCEYELAAAISAALPYGSRVIIEKYLKTPIELECAFLEGEKFDIFTSPGSVAVSEGFYSYDKKYATPSAKISSKAEIPDDVSLNIREFAHRLIRFASLKDLARIDFFLSEDNALFFNEVNTFPGMTETSLYPKMLLGEGIGEEDFFKLLSIRLRRA